MKFKLLLITCLFFFSFTLFAQSAPEKFNYQGVAKNGDALITGDISLRISIREASSSGLITYQEEHNTTTNSSGVFSIAIGTGSVSVGNFETIAWKANDQYLQVEMDPDGGNNFVLLGSTQLLSVPYALYGEDEDADPNNEIQTIQLDGSTITLSNNGGSINLPTGTTDTDNQTLSLSGTNLSIDDGNTVDLSSLQDGTTDADANPTNELQTISLNGSTISLSNNGGSVNLPTGTTDTDNQTLSLSGTNLSIDDGNTVDLSSLQDGTTDADANPTNELQTISLNGSTISLSNNGGSVNLPTGTTDTDNQNLSLSGTNLSIDDGNTVDLSSLQDGTTDADADPNNEIELPSGGNVDQLLQTDGNGNYSWTDPQIEHGWLKLDNSRMRTEYAGYRVGVNTTPTTALDVEYDSDLEVDGVIKATNYSEGFPNTPAVYGYSNPSTGNGIGGKFTGGRTGVEAICRASSGSATFYGLKGTVIQSGAPGNEGFTSIGVYGYASTEGHNDIGVYGAVGDYGKAGLFDGYVEVNGTLNALYGRVKITDDDDDENPRMEFRNQEDMETVQISTTITGHHGRIDIKNNAEDIRLTSLVLPDGAGLVETKGPNGNFNVTLSNLVGGANNGYIAVQDANGSTRAGMYIDNFNQSALFADVKNFRMDHPEQEDKHIWYASVEGPEAAAYERGTATLENGEITVTFSDHFQLVGNSTTMTVLLTPLEWDPYGLAVIEKTATGFTVKELKGGTGNFSFDWEVKCVRNGYENYEVIRDKTESQQSTDPNSPN